MCTLTIIVGAPGEFTLGFNRDEKPSRHEGAPIVRGTARRYIAPSDLASGGSWIAANDAGLAVALLNRSAPVVDDADAGASRGLLVPRVAECSHLAEIATAIGEIAPSIGRGFRLIATDGESVLEAVGSGRRCEVSIEPLHGPFLRASSGLGDHLVEPPRGELFAATVGTARLPELPDAQRAFHHHRWDDRRQLSVLMDRDGARTVSQSFVRVDRTRVVLTHALREGDSFATPSILELPRT